MKMRNSSRESKFVPVLGMPTSIITHGSLPEPDSQTDRVLFLIIPGNPGVMEYYDLFMERLFLLSGRRVPVWGISHAGHVKIPPDGNAQLYENLSDDVCTLEGQIRHKVAFIKEHIPSDVKLMLIGHSIGCYIILKVLEDLDKHEVLRCFLLFPTIERMASSPNGLVYQPLLKYFRWVAVLVTILVTFLPTSLKTKLIKWHFGTAKAVPECAFTATLSLLDPFCVGMSTFMANIELKSVVQLDKELLQKHLPRLSFYYGANDDWCPASYFHDMEKLFPKADMRLCDKGYSHAFVLDASMEMAEVVWEWFKPQM